MATDNFNRADGGLGANWTGAGGSGDGCEIASNRARLSALSSWHLNGWVADSFDADQFSEVTTIDVSGAADNEGGPGVLTRFDDDPSFAAYILRQEANRLQLDRFGPGGGQLDEDPVEAVAGDLLRLESEGTTHSGYLNDVLEVQATDAGLTEGPPGIGGRLEGGEVLADSLMDDWEGDSLGGGGGSILLFVATDLKGPVDMHDLRG